MSNRISLLFVPLTSSPTEDVPVLRTPGSRRMDYFTKLFKYRTAGVREYWIVDPDRKRITVYDFESEDIRDYGFSDTVKAGIYDDLYIDFSDIAKLLNI